MVTVVLVVLVEMVAPTPAQVGVGYPMEPLQTQVEKAGCHLLAVPQVIQAPIMAVLAVVVHPTRRLLVAAVDIPEAVVPAGVPVASTMEAVAAVVVLTTRVAINPTLQEPIPVLDTS